MEKLKLKIKVKMRKEEDTMEFDINKFEIEEIENIEAPGDGAFWGGVAVGVLIGIALC